MSCDCCISWSLRDRVALFRLRLKTGEHLEKVLPYVPEIVLEKALDEPIPAKAFEAITRFLLRKK